MNYFEIIKKVAVSPGINLKEPQGFDTIDPQINKIKIAINQALKSICSCWDWNFKIRKTAIQVVPGTKDYSGVNGKITNIYYEKDSDTSIELVFNPDLQVAEESGTPYSYGIGFENIVLTPVPTEAGNLAVYYLTDNLAMADDLLTEKAELELATDVPIIPEKFQDLIIYKAVLNFFSRPSKKEYPYYLAQYCERLVQAKTDDKGSLENTSSIEISGRQQFNKRFGRL